MTVGAKLKVKAGQSIAVFGLPADVDLELPDHVPAAGAPDVAIGFAINAATAEDLHVVIASARTDRVAWIAYPKGGQLGTDLSRGKLVALMAEHHLQPVRQIAIDSVWSAMRFRPVSD
ncbi:hypothetical protein Back2_10300 [Nocardioides baekrokdamisoli]|uniref:DUF3052 domain-containing protein n=1 Tax=Nocardioides baekrokdamisoli TaxID=1804624 RepID=A0A3G9IWL1_9ACTN|nr:hypothetical protein [Nocardioides baekrokdamisoli]BBH16743.1 hypothetical protein Back2_10300 [Nocardioides baekrokdamisoli]